MSIADYVKYKLTSAFLICLGMIIDNITDGMHKKVHTRDETTQLTDPITSIV